MAAAGRRPPAEGPPHAFLVRARRMRALAQIDEGALALARCRCLVRSAKACNEHCERCGGVGPHRLSVKADEIRCRCCSYVRALQPIRGSR